MEWRIDLEAGRVGESSSSSSFHGSFLLAWFLGLLLGGWVPCNGKLDGLFIHRAVEREWEGALKKKMGILSGFYFILLERKHWTTSVVGCCTCLLLILPIWEVMCFFRTPEARNQKVVYIIPLYATTWWWAESFLNFIYFRRAYPLRERDIICERESLEEEEDGILSGFYFVGKEGMNNYCSWLLYCLLKIVNSHLGSNVFLISGGTEPKSGTPV